MCWGWLAWYAVAVACKRVASGEGSDPPRNADPSGKRKKKKEKRKGTPVGVVEEGWAVHLPTGRFLAEQAVPVQSP